jgi:drug/metabolite transporter (DMT)-like permease
MWRGHTNIADIWAMTTIVLAAILARRTFGWRESAAEADIGAEMVAVWRSFPDFKAMKCQVPYARTLASIFGSCMGLGNLLCWKTIASRDRRQRTSSYHPKETPRAKDKPNHQPLHRLPFFNELSGSSDWKFYLDRG